jgi:cobalt-zinc-cadmium efflux system outer membrane protein
MLTGHREDATPEFRLIDTAAPPSLSTTSDSLVAMALVTRGDLQAATLGAESARTLSRLSRAERIPTPVLSGGFKNERITSGETLTGFVVGLRLPLPLWDRRAGAVAASDAEAARLAAVVDSLRREAVREVEDGFAAHAALETELGLVGAQLGEEAGRARTAADTAYREGEISLLEWLDSVRAYYEAEVTYITLWSELVARRAALERATGVTLF